MLVFEEKKRRFRQINLIPLINVIFLLLIFFLLAGKIEQHDVTQLSIPAAESGQAVDPGEIIVLLNTRNEVYINGGLVPERVITARMQQLLEMHPNAIITVKADAQQQASRLIDLLQSIRSAGGVQVGLATQKSTVTIQAESP